MKMVVALLLWMLWCAGYLLLAGRVRHSSEESEIISVLESVFRHKLDPHSMFSVPSVDLMNVSSDRRRSQTLPLTLPLLRGIMSTELSEFDGVVWTHNMRRMTVLIEQSLRFAEPVLLIGETGYVAHSLVVDYVWKFEEKFGLFSCNSSKLLQSTIYASNAQNLKRKSKPTVQSYELN